MHQEDSRYHVPAMVNEVLTMFEQTSHGVVLDATFGGGGHSRALLEALPGIELVAVDRDPDAAANADWHLATGRFSLIQGDFADLATILAHAGVSALSGALFDLGVSSHQLDDAGRGFSYHRSGPLDMRMGPDAPHLASEIVNEWSEADLASAIRRFGEERHARRIARAIVRARPLNDTAALADVVRAAVPAAARYGGAHPARRTFQAIRIAANDELAALRAGLDCALGELATLGRCVVISYHSLEDRIVKRRFAQGAQDCICPPDLPVCGCDRVAELRILTRKPLRPGEDEVKRNPRARSARLRAAEKVAA